MKRAILALSFFFIFSLSITFVYGESVELRILHLNDFHGFVEPFKPLGSNEMVGGMVYLAARVEELRREKPSLLLAAGDMIVYSDSGRWLRDVVVEFISEAGRIAPRVEGRIIEVQ